MGYKFNVLIALGLVAPEVAALSDNVVQHIDLVNERQEALAFWLVLQVLLHFVSKVVF